MTNKPRRLTGNRTVYTYTYLYLAAGEMLKHAEKQEAGRFFYCLSAMLNSAFALEAYINHLGAEFVTNWDKKERFAGRDGRLKLLEEALDIKIDLESPPFVTLSSIFIFRDSLAHGKTWSSTSSSSKSEVTYGSYKLPAPNWEEMCSLDSARLFVTNAGNMIRILSKMAKQSGDPLLRISTSSGYVASD